MLKQMNENDMREANGGGFFCNYCGVKTWSKKQMKAHQIAAHGCGGWFGKSFAYHFHWFGDCTCR